MRAAELISYQYHVKYGRCIDTERPMITSELGPTRLNFDLIQKIVGFDSSLIQVKKMVDPHGQMQRKTPIEVG
jgi:hypothetical protein